ncbi:uncharacterized protein Z519_02820 [Cladophialophora bantiana CBS 173.52]|uniref:NmrA-like domain-containing protein n=1 Tax=Cladophialophora bantiana (strain ATCC 10958 / CBS 173.52 / CDC B-1940 / NIH 8579) TaxID=1442370 RepID=A0A0D2F0K1_CLAB1|nr:uncharacterized protein Z519_02820 [Cladophialophora bantiana CBS 173.52]KIW95756.1 hypothetical protein Z519_02820 [Cladophialophora bantiana CBS 173.52]
MSSSGYLKNVIIFGAGGTNIGHHVVKALTSKPDLFNVSIIARKTSKSTFPEGVEVHYVDDGLPHDQLVKAMQGQDAVISAIGFGAIVLEEKLVDAAVEAKVKRFLPSEYGVNNTNPPARALCPVFDAKGAIIEYLKQKESSGLSWTAVPTGLWLDWSLEPAISFADINVKAHTARLWQDGTHKLSWSTLPWAAEGIAQILLAPSETTANKVVPLHGLSASQNDIVAALEHLQGTKYTITHFDADAVIASAQRSWRENKDTDSALALVKAGFFLDGYGSDFVNEAITPSGNEFLDLPPLEPFEEIVGEAVRRFA